MKTIDYYFWLNSDWAYLGADRLEALAARQQARIRYLPVDLPEVYARTGGVLLGQRAPERQAYRVTELARWCRKLGIHVNATPAHMCPDAGLASRLVIAADAAACRWRPCTRPSWPPSGARSGTSRRRTRCAPSRGSRGWMPAR